MSDPCKDYFTVWVIGRGVLTIHVGYCDSLPESRGVELAVYVKCQQLGFSLYLFVCGVEKFKALFVFLPPHLSLPSPAKEAAEAAAKQKQKQKTSK